MATKMLLINGHRRFVQVQWHRLKGRPLRWQARVNNKTYEIVRAGGDWILFRKDGLAAEFIKDAGSPEALMTYVNKNIRSGVSR